MNAITPYIFEGSAVRTVMLGDEPWFVATDVAAILGYGLASDMVRKLDSDEADMHNLHTSGQMREHSIISESGLYNAIFRSRRDEAKAFRRWVTHDVLPSIRQTGAYRLPADLPTVNAAVKMVEVARRVFGPAGAAEVWQSLGLPPVAALPVRSRSEPDSGLTARVSEYLAGLDEATVAEIADAVGEGSPDARMRRQIGQIARLSGFFPRTERRSGGVVSVFRRQSVEG